MGLGLGSRRGVLECIGPALAREDGEVSRGPTAPRTRWR